MLELHGPRERAEMSNRRVREAGAEWLLRSYLEPHSERAKLGRSKSMRGSLVPRVEIKQEAAQGVENLAAGEVAVKERAVVRVAEQQRDEVIVVVVDVNRIVPAPQLLKVPRNVQGVRRGHGPNRTRPQDQSCEIVPPPVLQPRLVLPPTHVQAYGIPEVPAGEKLQRQLRWPHKVYPHRYLRMRDCHAD